MPPPRSSALTVTLLALVAAGAAGAPATPAGEAHQEPAADPAAGASPSPPPAAVETPAPPSLPATPAGEAFAAWLAAVNSADEDRLTDFIGGRFAPAFLDQLPVDALVVFHLQLTEDGGELAFDRLLTASAHELKGLVGKQKGGALEVTVRVEPEPPHRIETMRVMPPAAPAAGVAGAEGEPEAAPPPEQEMGGGMVKTVLPAGEAPVERPPPADEPPAAAGPPPG